MSDQPVQPVPVADPTGQQRLPALFTGGEDASKVVDPEQRRPKYYGALDGAKNVGQKIQETVQDAAKGVVKGVKKVGQKTGQAVHQVASKTKQVGRKVEGKVQDVVEQIKTGKFPWLHVLVAGVAVLVAIKVFKASN